MAYSDDIDGLGPQHRWDFNSNSNDLIGAANGTDTTMTYTGAPLCEGVVNSVFTSVDTSRVSIPTTTDINNSAQTRKAVAGWFMVDSIQTPPRRIYGEGDNATTFQFILGFGNSPTFEVIEPTNFSLQIFGPTFYSNRIYHLCGIFEGSGFNNEIRFYIDGIEQTDATPVNRQPGNVDLDARGVAEFGDPAGTVGVGGDVVILTANNNGYYNQWATWDGASASMTTTQIRETLFERGALPSRTVSTDTEANMQIALDTFSNSSYGNESCSIRIEPLSGGGDLILTSTNITYDPLTSIHVQYTGVDTLTWRNDINSNATIFSTPFGGTIAVQNQTSLIISGLQNPTEVRIYDAGTISEITGQENVTTGTFQTNIYEDLVDIVLVSLAYEIKRLESVDTSSNTSLEITQFFDRVYLNPI